MRPGGAVLTMAVLALTAAGCTTQTPAKPAPKPSSTEALPALPSLPAGQVLLAEPDGAASAAFTTPALASRAIALQFTCLGQGPVGVRVYQGGAKPIYQVSDGTCDRTVQKIDFTATAAATPLKVDVTVGRSSTYALLVSQG